MTQQGNLLNVLCLYSKQQVLYIGFGIELFIVSGFVRDQHEFIESYKTLLVASFNPQIVDRRIVQVPLSDFQKTPEVIIAYWRDLKERVHPYITTLDGHPIHNGQGNIIVEPKDLPYYHLHFWLDTIEGKLPELVQDITDDKPLLSP